LPDGRTLRQLAGEDLDELVDHMDQALGGITASARLEDPYHPHWGTDRALHAPLPTQPAEVADRRELRRLLLDAPEALSEEGADFCVAAGIGFIYEPIRAWKPAGTDERA
jgi:hypothetical protein